jgi:hypothetical protein
MLVVHFASLWNTNQKRLSAIPRLILEFQSAGLMLGY